MNTGEQIKSSRILVIDDSLDIHEDYKKILQCDKQLENELSDLESELFDNDKKIDRDDFILDFASQGEEGYKKIVKSVEDGCQYDLAFVDMRMPPGWDGVETILKSWEVDPELEIVICSAYSDYSWQEIAEKLNNLGGYVILKKPFDSVEVKQLAYSLTKKSQTKKKREEKLAMAQDQLLQSEKMASIGQLAAGVAHEINNPVGFINSNVSTLETYIKDIMSLLEEYQKYIANDEVDKSKLKNDILNLEKDIDIGFLVDDMSSLLSESKEGIDRVKKIIQDLKDFAHVGEAKWESCDVNQSVECTLNVARNETKYHTEVITDFGEIPVIECIPHQINQVVLNLIVNASHAIEKNGIINIKTYQENDHVMIEVKDNGKGIAKENLNRIFDPFFTTKPVGKGTGLGLSLSYGIIKKHGGKISVDSEEGVGTIFTIKLPIKKPEDIDND